MSDSGKYVRIANVCHTKEEWETIEAQLAANGEKLWLYNGEIGFESDTNRYKVGMGQDVTWSAIPYYEQTKIGEDAIATEEFVLEEINKSLDDYATEEFVLEEINKNPLNISNGEGEGSIQQGEETEAIGNNSHAGGYRSKAIGNNSMAMGLENIALGNSSHAEGQNTLAMGKRSHAEGNGWYPYTDFDLNEESTIEDILTIWQNIPIEEGEPQKHKFLAALKQGSHAEGTDTMSYGYSAHAEGLLTLAKGENSHAEGQETEALGNYTHAEGQETIASGTSSHVEGGGTEALGGYTHAEGTQGVAAGNMSHVEGISITSFSDYDVDLVLNSSFAENADEIIEHWKSLTNINDDDSLAAKFSLAAGRGSHLEGRDNLTFGYASHAEGVHNIAYGNFSHVGGCSNTANELQYVIGKCSSSREEGERYSTTGSAFIIGNGVYDDNQPTQSNAFRVDYNGELYSSSSLNTSGADYAEYFEWLDSNVSKEDRRGYFVSLDGEKIKIAQPGDYILGVVSGQPAIIGNSDEDWQKKYLHDEFGAYIVEEFAYEERKSEGTAEASHHDSSNSLIKVDTKLINGTKYKLNPEYDPNQTYIPREKRPEWSAIGMLGVLSVRDDGTCQVNDYCTVAEGGIATAAETGYRVISRTNDHIIKIVFR